MPVTNLKKAFAKKQKATIQNVTAGEELEEVILSMIEEDWPCGRRYYICFHDLDTEVSFSLWERGGPIEASVRMVYADGKCRITEKRNASQKTIDAANLIVKTL